MQMANSMFKIKPLKVEIIKCILRRQLSRECADFSSKKSSSILRKNNTDDMRLLELKKVCDEFQERAPLFYSMLLTCAVANGRKQTETIKWLPSVAVTGAVLLRERCMFLNAVQLMVSVLVKFSGIQVGNGLPSCNLSCLWHLYVFYLTNLKLWEPKVNHKTTRCLFTLSKKASLFDVAYLYY